MRASFFHIILVVPQQSLAVLSWRLPLQPQHLLASASRRHSYRPLMSHYPSRFATSAANSFTIYKATGWKREGFCAGQGQLFEVDGDVGCLTRAAAQVEPNTCPKSGNFGPVRTPIEGTQTLEIAIKRALVHVALSRQCWLGLGPTWAGAAPKNGAPWAHHAPSQLVTCWAEVAAQVKSNMAQLGAVGCQLELSGSKLAAS